MSSGTTTEAIQRLMHEDESQSIAYLEEAFLLNAMHQLFLARRKAELTQADVASKLKTRQPAIARIEHDMDGNISLRRYVEFALACGMIPCDVDLVPVRQMMVHVARDAEAPRTSASTIAWNSIIDDAGTITVKDSIFHAPPIGHQSPSISPQKFRCATFTIQGVA